MASRTRDTAAIPHLPPGHVLVPAAAIGSLSIVLAAGLQTLGILNRANDSIGGLLSGGKDYPKSIPVPVIWLVAVVFAFGLSSAILGTPGTWRRVVLWVTSVVVVSGWAPVLALSARAPEITAVLIAVAWSGVCTLVYASRHEMACDVISKTASDETR